MPRFVVINHMERRTFLRHATGVAAAGTVGGVMPATLFPGCMSSAAQMIDRRSVIDRHAPVARGVEPFSVLTVGNGEFVE